jgi:hypothetical protein
MAGVALTADKPAEPADNRRTLAAHRQFRANDAPYARVHAAGLRPEGVRLGIEKSSLAERMCRDPWRLL